MNRCSHHILVLLQLFACADCLRASPAAFRAISASHTSSRNAPRMAAGGSKRAREMAAKKAQARPGYVPEGRNLKNGLPEEVFARTNFATSGARDANTVKEIEMNWAAFKGCFANEKLAIEAAKKNSAVFSPQFSRPSKIKGTYALLVKRLGKATTAELLMKNPGVLCNSVSGLEQCSDKEILDAAETVAFLDANKPLINGIAGVLLAAVVAAAIFRTTTANPTGAIYGM